MDMITMPINYTRSTRNDTKLSKRAEAKQTRPWTSIRPKNLDIQSAESEGEPSKEPSKISIEQSGRAEASVRT